MSEYDALKALAENATNDGCAYINAVSPDVVLGMIAKLEAFESVDPLMQYDSWHDDYPVVCVGCTNLPEVDSDDFKFTGHDPACLWYKEGN